MENGNEIKNYHDINEEDSSDNIETNSLSNTQSTSPLLPISIPFSNLNIRSNNGYSPTMESAMESNLSTLCTVASQEAKLYIPDKYDNKDKLFNNFQDSIKEEENDIKMDTKESNIFSKLDTTNRNAPTSLLTQNIQNSNKINRDEHAMMNDRFGSNISPILNNENSMEEDNKLIKTEIPSLSQPISMPMSLPTITINSTGLENGKERKAFQYINNLSSSVSSPLTLMTSSPKSPSTFSSTSSTSSSSSSSFNHSVPHTALQRRKSRSMGCSKDYVCEICKPNKHFVQLAHLRIHQRKHTGERPFICSYCNKSFAQQGNLKTHQRKHTGERPFTCPICFKTFTQSGNLKAHELLHQGVRPFVCEWCDKTFTQSGNLKTHQMKMHPDLIQHGDNALLKSPISSTRSSTEENDDKMQIDKMNEDEDNSQMKIDNNNTNYNNRPNPNQFFDSNNNNHTNNQYVEIDNEDYDEIQPMESGVIRSNSANNNEYYDNNYYYQNSENIKEEEDFEEDFEEDENSKYSTPEYESDNENFDSSFSNQPENNIKERQLLKRLKALLKRN